MFILLADRVSCVDFRDVGMPLLDGLFEFGFFGELVFGGFGGLAGELFGGELQGDGGSVEEGRRGLR
jgi:hypothetical protein